MHREVVNDSGERIIAGSRRPDGTLRKDVRVRAGYVPQEEQQVYQSRGTLARQGVPKVPGLDDSDLQASKAQARSKAAKKNERRKQKKVADQILDEGDEGQPSIGSLTAQLASSRLSEPESSFPKAPERVESLPKPHDRPEPASGGAQEADTVVSPLERKIRALRKKLKQADALVAKREAGEALTNPEREKVQKAAAWRAEIRELEDLLPTHD